MANEEQKEILSSGVHAWNEWRERNPETVVDLSKADISAKLIGINLSRANLRHANLCNANLFNASLRHADLFNADLSGADLRHASLPEANLTDAKLSHANLCDTDLSEATLRKADLSHADLRRAGLSHADLSHADLSHVNLSEAELNETSFINVNLSSVIGLKSCKHGGPSALDHRTLTQSGELPLKFLRGCGLPDDLIEYLPSLRHAPIRFYSAFISYSTKDQEFADRLYADLQNKGVRCWFAPHDIQGGKKIHEQIDEAIRFYQRLLLILSEDSMNSEWVKTEIAYARQKESNEKRRVLFPISIVPFDRIKAWNNFDADTGKDSAKEIREYFIPDFSDWKNHDAYTQAFDKLLRDLKAEKQTGAEA
jgi:uncharacterized protein YjbI with pentapeptide repeats